MNVPERKIQFSPPDISELEISYVAEAMRSGWITTGPRTKELEKRISAWVGTKKCVCLNSQTAAAETSLRVLGIGDGDEVITSAYTYTASASVVIHVGASLVLVDCSMKTGSIEMDYEALESAITEKTKVIIPVDIGGIPCDYERIYDIIQKKKNLFHPANPIQKAIGHIVVVADSAHSFGATYKGMMIGSVADFTNFSFHAVKNFTTAEGGAMVWKSIEGIQDEEIYHQAQLLSLHGQSKDALAKGQTGAWEYDILGPWYKCNMTDIAASIGLAQLERYSGMLARRKEIIEKYDAAFKPLGVEVLDHYTDNYQSTGHLYITRVFKKNGTPINNQERRDIIVKMNELGVSCNVHYKVLPLHTAYKAIGYDIEGFPNSYMRYLNEITLPLHTLLSDDDVEYVIKCYSQTLSELFEIEGK